MCELIPVPCQMNPHKSVGSHTAAVPMRVLRDLPIDYMLRAKLWTRPGVCAASLMPAPRIDLHWTAGTSRGRTHSLGRAPRPRIAWNRLHSEKDLPYTSPINLFS